MPIFLLQQRLGRVLMPKMVDVAATVASSLVTVVFMVLHLSSLMFHAHPNIGISALISALVI